MSPELLALVAKSKAKYASGGMSRTIKPKEGRNVYRILGVNPGAPWKRASEMPFPTQFWRDLGVHWIKPSENAKPIAVVGAPDVVFDQPNPMAIAIDAAIASALDEDTKKLYESWRARRSVLVNVIDIQDATNQDPQILELTGTTWSAILDIYTEWGAAGKDITSLSDGINLVITRAGKGLNTTYTVQPAPTSAPLSPALAAKIQDLDAFIESNFFKGEETKALNFIQQTTGTLAPLLAPAAARTPTAALASPAAVVPDAAPVAAAVVTPAAAPVAEAPIEQTVVTPAAPVESDLDRQRRELEAQLAALNATPAAAPAAAPVAEAPAAPAADAGKTDVEILAELEGLLVS